MRRRTTLVQLRSVRRKNSVETSDAGRETDTTYIHTQSVQTVGRDVDRTATTERFTVDHIASQCAVGNFVERDDTDNMPHILLRALHQ